MRPSTPFGRVLTSTTIAALVLSASGLGTAMRAAAADSATQGKAIAFVPGVTGNAF